MIYGVIQLINFAHGEVFMVGAYAALTLVLWATAVLGATWVPWWKGARHRAAAPLAVGISRQPRWLPLQGQAVLR